MDYDETVNISAFNSDDELPSSISRHHLTQEIIFGIFALIGIWADIAIIYTLFQFRRMRLVPNILLGNWAIADFFCLIVTPSSYRIISVIKHSALSHEFLCFLQEYGITLHLTVLLFVIIVTIDWFVAAYLTRASEKIRSNYKFIILSVWLLAIIWSSTFSALCMSEPFLMIHQRALISISYLAILLMVIICQISRAVQKCRRRPNENPTIMLTLATVFIISSFLSFIGLFSSGVMSAHPIFTTISTCLLFSNSVSNFIILYFFDQDFQACLLQILKRHRYEESIAEFGNPIRNEENTEVPFKMAFHNSEEHLSEELLANEY